MNYNVLAEFGFNGRKYVFYTLIDKPYNMLYGYYDDGIIKPVITLREFIMMKEASRQIFISNDPMDHVKLNVIKYNGKLFQIMYDKASKFKYFYEIRDNKFYIPNEKDLLNLSSIYNRQIVTSIDENSNDHEYEHKKLCGIKKVILLAGVYVVTLISTISIFNTYIEPTTSPTAEQTIEQPMPTPTVAPTAIPKIEFSLDKLVEALNSNTNLTDNEKTFLSEYLKVLEENSEYVDMGKELQKLQSLLLKYDTNLKHDGVVGTCDIVGNFITLNGPSSFDHMSYEEKKTLVHEFFHSLSNCNYITGYGIAEALTESMVCEFTNSPSNVYFETRQYLNMLCEIIGPKPILGFYFSGDINCLINPLKQLIPDENLAYQLISGLDDIQLYSNSNALGLEISSEEAKANCEMGRFLTNDAISKYFTAAKGYPMEEDAIMSIYQSRANGEGNRFYISLDGNEIMLSGPSASMRKGYFIDSYVSKTPEAVIRVFPNNNDMSEFVDCVIDDSNRRLTSSTINEGAYVLQSKLLNEGMGKD